jgi:hypothetical protein
MVYRDIKKTCRSRSRSLYARAAGIKIEPNRHYLRQEETKRLGLGTSLYSSYFIFILLELHDSTHAVSVLFHVHFLLHFHMSSIC